MMNNRGEWSEATRSVGKEKNTMKKDTKEERKQDQGIIDRIELKQMQWDMAMNGNVQMLIWLGKQYLGQSDKPQIKEERMYDRVVFIDEDGNEESGFKL